MFTKRALRPRDFLWRNLEQKFATIALTTVGKNAASEVENVAKEKVSKKSSNLRLLQNVAV